MTKVFISYSHDSDEHRRSAWNLSERLRTDGVETVIDWHVNGSPEQGWPRWMLDQLDAADFVLVVCSETYHRRFRGHETLGKGSGGDWEGALITQALYDLRSRTLKFVPVFLSQPTRREWIPEPLRLFTHYDVGSREGYDRLCDFLLGRAGVAPGPVASPQERRHEGTVVASAGSDPTPASTTAATDSAGPIDDGDDPESLARRLFHKGDDGPLSLVPYWPTRNQLMAFMLGWAGSPGRVQGSLIKGAISAGAQSLEDSLAEVTENRWVVKNADETYTLTSTGREEAVPMVRAHFEARRPQDPRRH